MPNLAILKIIFRFRTLVALYVAAETAFKVAKFVSKQRKAHAK